MSRLDKEGLSHLNEPLAVQGKHTVQSLVDLILTDRPKFLPTLKELGVAKLPDRQAVRDLISPDPDPNPNPNSSSSPNSNPNPNPNPNPGARSDQRHRQPAQGFRGRPARQVRR